MLRIIIGILVILLGISALTGLPFFKFFFAAILIVLGVRIITGRRYHNNWHKKETVSNESELNEVVIFSGLNKAIRTDNFKNGKVDVVFGGANINLRDSKTLEKNIDVEITTVFGGCKIMIPKDWKVNIKGTSILGGYDDKTEGGEKNVTINIKGVAIFGGIEILN